MDKNAFGSAVEQAQASDRKTHSDFDTSQLWHDAPSFNSERNTPTSKDELNRLGLPAVEITNPEPAVAARVRPDDSKAQPQYEMPQSVVEMKRALIPQPQTTGGDSPRKIEDPKVRPATPEDSVRNRVTVADAGATFDGRLRDGLVQNLKPVAEARPRMDEQIRQPVAEVRPPLGERIRQPVAEVQPRTYEQIHPPISSPTHETWYPFENHNLSGVSESPQNPPNEKSWTRKAREAREDNDVLRRHIEKMDKNIDDRISADELKDYVKELSRKLQESTDPSERSQLSSDLNVLNRVDRNFGEIKGASNDDWFWETGISRKDMYVREHDLTEKDKNATDADEVNLFVQKHLHDIDKDNSGGITQKELYEYKRELQNSSLGYSDMAEQRNGVLKTIDNFSKMAHPLSYINREDTLALLEDAEAEAK